MNEYIPPHTQHPRRYARRLPPAYARTTTLTIRLTPAMKDALAYLAACRRISMSEYTARMVGDHLASACKARQ